MAAYLEEFFANVQTFESTVTSANVNFDRQSAKIIITNDSGSEDLTVQMKPNVDSLTLKPTESLTLHYRTRQLVLTGNGVPCRVWAFG